MVRQLTLHLLWIIAVLVAVIAAFVVITPSGDLLKEYISFASAISSILLALVAIFYAFISSGTVNSTLSDIKAAAQTLTAQADRLTLTSSGINGEAQDILRKLSALPDHVTEFRGEVARKIDDLVSSKLPNELDAESGRGARSFGHNISIYILARASKSKRSFDINKIFDGQNDATPRWYCLGIIEILKYYKVNGLCVEGIEGKYYVTDMGSFNADEIISRTKKSLEKINSDVLKAGIERIDNYFDVVRPTLEKDDIEENEAEAAAKKDEEQPAEENE